MSKGIYITTTGPNSGKSIVSLGLMQILLGKAAKVGYFRPIIDNLKDGKMDNHIITMINHFELIIAPKDAYVFTRSELIHLLNKGKEGEIVSKIIDKYKTLKDNLLGKTTLMPYASIQHANYERLKDPMNFTDLGITWLLNGQTSKLTAAYQSRPLYNNAGQKVDRKGSLIIQYQVYFN